MTALTTILAGMAEGRVAEIMHQRHRLGDDGADSALRDIAEIDSRARTRDESIRYRVLQLRENVACDIPEFIDGAALSLDGCCRIERRHHESRRNSS